MPMRFTKAGGSLIDVYQAATDSADDATASPDTVVPAEMRALIDRALGTEGYYGAFTVIVHSDSAAPTRACATRSWPTRSAGGVRSSPNASC